MDTASSGTTGRRHRSFPSFHVCFTTVSSAAAAYRVRNDPWNLAFVLAAYVNLALLLWCVAALQRATTSTAATGPLNRKEVLRPMVWLLATTLNLSFTHKVTRSMERPLAVAVWSLAAMVTAAGFYGAVVFCKGQYASSPGPSKNGSWSKRTREPRSSIETDKAKEKSNYRTCERRFPDVDDVACFAF